MGISAAGAKTSTGEDETVLWKTTRSTGLFPRAEKGGGCQAWRGDHKEAGPWEIMGRALNHLTPSYQGSLTQAFKLPPVPTRKTAVGSYVASFFYACPPQHCQFSTRSHRELLRCNQVLTSTFIKSLSPGLFPPPLTASCCIYNKIPILAFMTL